MTLTDRVKFLQKAAIVHDGKALILQRSETAKYRPGAWDLPGGNAEWPTTDQSSANLHQLEIVRELQEETGFSFEPANFIDENLVHFTTYFEADIPRYAIICGWRVETDDNFNPSELTLSDEHTKLAWVGLNDLENYDFGEPVGTFVKTIIQKALKE
jgi:8-oxo-dGTP pyrophosphatase MutT (NUDIX family)